MSGKTQRYEFDARELLAAMIKAKDIHDGIWGLELRYEFFAMTFEPPSGGLAPASVNVIQRYVLARAEEVGPLSVDAAVINPGGRIIDPFKR